MRKRRFRFDSALDMTGKLHPSWSYLKLKLNWIIGLVII